MSLQQAFRGGLLGLAAGDALGAPLEFSRRNAFIPVYGFSKGGPWKLNPGEWTDDTSMALCLATSLVESGGLDLHDQMQRYLRWYQEGYMSVSGNCFDIGTTTLSSLQRYKRYGIVPAGDPNPQASGNGGLMRLLPVILATWDNPLRLKSWVEAATMTTHASPDCLDASLVFADAVSRVLEGEALQEVLASPQILGGQTRGQAIERVLEGNYRHLDRSELGEGFYVIEALENAFWACWKGGSLKQTLLRAANLGGDADTVAAIAGQLVGVVKGEALLPDSWKQELAWCEKLQVVADDLLDLNQKLRQLPWTFDKLPAASSHSSGSHDADYRPAFHI
ncbi:ADP-ribosyl-[dinitrogen reductase] hydrolase [Marinospirillum celere]|uniref:ADP-ribosyl-[dinitrogen reductase] hydrolase n=1 Tax=Marinospirillum celere TaxID=1122252 RepID=A0A1I1EJ72_9GAMM|nr:ADP-ribosylglycohydrolase family protein [Marinospirillum celere]SFB87175.1 ADP-ribosyl-[dinitrogen reductase] hydrolase [Marinospirillum celere]